MEIAPRLLHKGIENISKSFQLDPYFISYERWKHEQIMKRVQSTGDQKRPRPNSKQSKFGILTALQTTHERALYDLV